ncbi:BlaI/MecI/CopY family transcriptional regulator [Rhodococcus kroppenstedtii]|uniref:BlaI/MecI/CopY family transcriptional regulator n=1 Tax=Rhodococcoides kroppenstedtii TaxID=293050 RepID=UPI0029529BB6|nr:BlaI/MecI/CopY family transcriptional regulator [Rhodococcus kroppenstedtii]MDV7199624.1 BlaI/MecI/CopY family transcriptional regulator [Rhodococcus kroppenstedtii]
MQGLGELEAVVMDSLWRRDAAMRVRDVRDAMVSEREFAYTTVMTVLENLHRKHWVTRERIGRAYWYLPARTREEAAAAALRAVLVSTGDPAGVLLHFAKGASDDESKVLARGLRERADETGEASV